jgi:amino acid transporter
LRSGDERDAALSDTREGLVRAIGRWDLTALVVNCVIGAGIFGLPTKVYLLVGTYSPFVFVACGVLAFFLILCFAEVGSRFRTTGGPYLYAHAAFGPWTGFVTGWLAWLARLSSFAALVNLFVTYAGWFVPGLDAGWSRIVACSALTLGLGALNTLGVRGSTRVGNVLTIGKLAPLLLLVAVGVFFVDGARFALGPAPSLDDFSKAVLLLVFAYSGFETAIIPSGEAIDPRRDIGFALIAAMSIVTAVYLGVQFVCIGSLDDLGSTSRPLAAAAAQFAGGAGALVIAVGALVSIGGNINATMLAAPRLLFAMAERGQMPAALARVHARFRTPHVAIAATTAAMLAAAVSGGFIVLVLISTVSRLVVYATTCAAVLAMRRRDPEPAAFTVPGGAAVPLVALALCAWLLLHSTWNEAAVVTLVLLVGLLPYAMFRNRWRRKPLPAP